jgi:hypothetical protein
MLGVPPVVDREAVQGGATPTLFANHSWAWANNQKDFVSTRRVDTLFFGRKSLANIVRFALSRTSGGLRDDDAKMG